MKILLVNDYYEGGGAESVFRASYDLLKDEGYDVDYFVGKKEITKPKGVVSYIENRNVAERFKQKVESFQPTVVHIHNFYHFISGSIFSVIKEYRKQNTLKVVFTAHDYYLISPSSGLLSYKNDQPIILPIKKVALKNTLFKSIDHRGFRYSWIKKLQWWYNVRYKKYISEIDLIISPSYFLKQAFVKAEVPNLIKVVRNPYHGSQLVGITKTATSKAIKIIYTGRLSKEKGILPFLESLVKHKILGITLDIFGKGEQEEQIKKYIELHQLNYINLHGYLNPKVLKKHIEQANVHLLPSLWYENAPLSIIEAACAGNIILASNTGGVAELTKLSTSYVLVNCWDKEIKQAIEKIQTKEVNQLLDPTIFSNQNYINSLVKIYQ